MAANGMQQFRAESRKKGLYSLFRKLERKDWDITKIHDILALRVIVSSIAECYTTLGVIHAQWRPVLGKIKDYIAVPKPNGYQSLHTTIYTGDGGTLEIQVRTEAMHREAQFGIASHLSYKESSHYVRGTQGGGMEWVRQFMGAKPEQPLRKNTLSKGQSVPQWVKELADIRLEEADSAEYLEDIKTDFFSHRVFAFTPKGDVIDLPIDATPIDFAYAIHSDIGDHISGAKVNGKLVALDTELKNGDLVEIATKQSAKPSKKWLDMARTTMARKHIRQALGMQK
jgi:GTP pyrophosphokinase